jgi:tetratricopeptide (TPR) repeat protein
MNRNGSGGDPEKLEAYVAKDYSENIDFPVELVDRDGVVRRYSYEESLAVYHRRIQSAPWRYAEDDLIRAEIGHCSRRIDQIKRSYNARARRGDASPTDPRAALGEGFEILSAHYEEQLDRRGLEVEGPLRLELSLLEDRPGCRVYHVGFGDGPGHLLYVYLLDQRGDRDPLLAFREARDQYRGMAIGRDVERLLLSVQGREAGFLLTGTADLPEALLEVARPVPSEPVGESESEVDWMLEGGAPRIPKYLAEQEHGDDGGPFEEGLEALSEERAERAVERFVEAVQRNPYHREAYLALLAVLDGSGRYEEAEFYGALAARYLEADGLVRYRQGINFVRQGRFGEAVEAFDDACRLAPDLYPPAYFGAHVLIAQGMDLRGAITRLELASITAPDEEHIAESLRIARTFLRARTGTRFASAVLALLSVGVAAVNVWAGLAGLVGAAVIALLSGPLTAIGARRAAQKDVAPTSVAQDA